LAARFDEGPSIAPAIAGALRSDSSARRFAAALVVGFAKVDELADEAVPILVERLADNDTPCDASHAAVALENLLDRARPALDAVTADDDRQRRRFAARLIASHDASRSPPVETTDLP